MERISIRAYGSIGRSSHGLDESVRVPPSVTTTFASTWNVPCSVANAGSTVRAVPGTSFRTRRSDWAAP